MSRVHVPGERVGLEGDPLVVGDGAQEAPAHHDLAEEQRGRRVDVDQIHAAAGRACEVCGEVGDLVQARAAREAHRHVHVAAGRQAPRGRRSENVREQHARPAGQCRTQRVVERGHGAILAALAFTANRPACGARDQRFPGTPLYAALGKPGQHVRVSG